MPLHFFYSIFHHFTIVFMIRIVIPLKIIVIITSEFIFKLTIVTVTFLQKKLITFSIFLKCLHWILISDIILNIVWRTYIQFIVVLSLDDVAGIPANLQDKLRVRIKELNERNISVLKMCKEADQVRSRKFENCFFCIRYILLLLLILELKQQLTIFFHTSSLLTFIFIWVLSNSWVYDKFSFKKISSLHQL